MNHMKKIILLAASILFATAAFSQDSELQSLKDTYARWIKAWNDQNAEMVAKISWENYGFGRDVPFMRTGTTDSVAYKSGMANYMASMRIIDYKEHQTDYRIIESTGLINGFYAQTTQQENGPLRTVYGRQSLVFIKQNGNWKMVHYHRSALPNEFVR